MNPIDKNFLFRVVMLIFVFIICVINLMTIKLNLFGVFALGIGLMLIISTTYEKHISKDTSIYYKKNYKDIKEAEFNMKAYLNFFIPLEFVLGFIFLIVGIIILIK